ncbi:uncharacterized protein LOC125104014 isoform X2 [Lutra lutra]|nr:uncharacterized protein LOC125104014 isoform X2 [Lutra lutra]XP_047592142.1 uncharacterized protein LOC125104014 isoform X2 [Lutra lutra]
MGDAYGKRPQGRGRLKAVVRSPTAGRADTGRRPLTISHRVYLLRDRRRGDDESYGQPVSRAGGDGAALCTPAPTPGCLKAGPAPTCFLSSTAAWGKEDSKRGNGILWALGRSGRINERHPPSLIQFTQQHRGSYWRKRKSLVVRRQNVLPFAPSARVFLVVPNGSP